MLLVANLANTKRYKKKRKMIETLAYGYSSESTPRELSNYYQHDRVLIVFNSFLRHCALDESSLSIRRVKCALLCNICLDLLGLCYNALLMLKCCLIHILPLVEVSYPSCF